LQVEAYRCTPLLIDMYDILKYTLPTRVFRIN